MADDTQGGESGVPEPGGGVTEDWPWAWPPGLGDLRA